MLFKENEMMNFRVRKFIDSTSKNLLNINQDIFNKSIDPDLIKASVLIPITFWENELVIMFTKRSNLVNNHQNQISFPGGTIEKVDANPLAAALRETKEEIGLKKDGIEILGELEAENTTTGFYIYPFVSFIHNLDEIQINKFEVDRIIYIPLNWLRNPKNSYTEIYKGQNTERHSVIVFSDYDGEKVWGITASLVKRLLKIVKK